MLHPKEFIEQIQQRILHSDWEFALDGYAGSIDRLQKAFPRYGSFLMEFIQNADDAHSSKMKIEISPDALHISNNGWPFSEKDVTSICKVGRSSKTVQDYIGYLGVGFKAVFLISKKPQIYSGAWQFTFDQDHWNDSRIPWQIVPLWLAQPLSPISSEYNTQFYLPLYGSAQIPKTEIDSLNSRILLFLNHLQELECVNQQHKHRTITKSFVSETADYQLFQLQESTQGVAHPPEQWLLFHAKFTVPNHVQNDSLTIEWERQQVSAREVAVAFKLDHQNNLSKGEKGTAHIGVFSFLPLKEIPSGLSFVVQADFLTMTGRGELARECQWNTWLADCLRELLVAKCIPAFLAHDSWKFHFTEILYALPGGHELFEQRIKKPLREYLLQHPVLVAEDGSSIKIAQALMVEKKLRPLLDGQLLQQLYPQKKVLHERCSIPAALQNYIEKGPALWGELSSEEKLQELLQLKARQKDLTFFLEFYRSYLIPAVEENPSLLLRLKDKPLFLTDDALLIGMPSLYLNPRGLKVPFQLREFLKLVHPALTSDNALLDFFSSCRLPTLSQEDIDGLLRSKELLYVQQHWNSFSDEEKKAKIITYKELWEKGSLMSQHLGFITLPDRSGEWVPPTQLIFSAGYNPICKLHELQAKGLLDFPFNFVDDGFVHNCTEHQKSSWHQFFRQLGVDAKLSEKRFKKNIIERIGVLLALRYEQHKGRKAQEIPHSQEVFGYDLMPEEEGEGFVQSAERYIEIKSSEKPNPDIYLTTRQFRTLQEQRERYFVYVITDALRNPTLHVTRGDQLLMITQIRTVIPFRKWWDSAKEEEFKGS
ncbi:DUF3883 domain-containing protein [Candidatus Woesearchaeota archaeon]|nr:DUF3883 domain-containing protein [Candidatus Woesearchaeota archaeon]